MSEVTNNKCIRNQKEDVSKIGRPNKQLVLESFCMLQVLLQTCLEIECVCVRSVFN